MNITVVTHDLGPYILLSIYDMHNETDLLTFDKRFNSNDEIEVFKKGKLFQRVFNTIYKIKQYQY